MFAAGLLFATTGEATTLRVATMAPKSSPWGRVYSAWAMAFKQATHGAVTVQMLWNGTGGPSSSEIAEINAGTLDGAVVSTADLSAVHPDVLVLELPVVLRTWNELDARGAAKPALDAALNQAGLRSVAWEDFGMVRLFTQHFAASRPGDLANKSVRAWSGDVDPIASTLLSSLSAAPSRFSLSALPSRPFVDAAFTAATVAAPAGFDHVDAEIRWCAGGALIFGDQALTNLPPGAGAMFDAVNAAAERAAAKIVRREDDAAYSRISRNATVVRHTGADALKWEALFRSVALKLVSSGKVGKAAVNRVLGMQNLLPIP